MLPAGVPVTIYQGQLDLICCTLGVDTWLQRLTWSGLQGFQAAARKPFYREDQEDGQSTAGFVRGHKNLAMYYIMEAGGPPLSETLSPATLLQQFIEDVLLPLIYKYMYSKLNAVNTATAA